MFRGVLLCIALSSSMASMAQGDSTAWVPRRYPGFHHDELVLVAGYHQGSFGFAELGIGRSVHGMMHHPYGLGYSLGFEARVDRPGIIGVKAGGYIAGGPAMGVQFIHYMHGAETMEVLRPEIGIGLFKVRLTYAYNWRLTKPRIDGVSTHMVSLCYALRMARLKNDDARRRSLP